MATFTQIILPVLSGVLLAVVTGLMAFFRRQAKEYKTMLAEQKESHMRKLVQEEVQPIIDEIHLLQGRLKACEDQETDHIDIILGSYKFRLIYLCRSYIRQGYMTQDQYDQLSEFYRVYHELGGNGQAQEYYERAMQLEIRQIPQEE